ncbi:RusA family crossover junction endodeoxyribonuclease [Burkholderia pseudomallei]|uniref:RusA family crossover junction endodeoxyribonuclease n=1 Tax=Burkholderia pseudomallei TaxID=28450 RepID=UPI000F04C1BD|nr:RusA family crossover junction endodeoxyribonuclease [Burkholderia pseudomallei]VBO15398.1 Holliday junction resolvase [Burkholderia pseudomallei]
MHGACSDAMNGVVYGDDVAVVSGTVHKRYSIDPRVEITVYAFEPNPMRRDDDSLDALEAEGAVGSEA